MTTNKTIGLFLLATTFLSTPAGAQDITEWTEEIENGRGETIDNIKVDVDGEYSLIYNRGQIGNIESTFTNNYEVIRNYGEIGTVRSVFKNNENSLENYGLIEQVAGSVFENNINSYGGGAIASTGGGYIGKIVDSTFTGNTVYEQQPARIAMPEKRDVGRGGALYLENPFIPQAGSLKADDLSVTHIVNSTFKGNHAAAGGAIFSSQWLDIEGSVFDGNYNQTRDEYGAGGAIAFRTEEQQGQPNNMDERPTPEEPFYAGEHNISNSRFENNRSSGFGGAIAGMVNEYTNQTYGINVKGSTFINNSAKDGGAVYMMSGMSENDRRNVEDAVWNMPEVNKVTIKYGDQEKTLFYLKNNQEERYNIYNMTAAEFDQYVREGGKFYVHNIVATAVDAKTYQDALDYYQGEIQPGYGISDFEQYKDALYQADIKHMLTPSLKVVNSSFINNKASGKGGAIYGSDVRIVADNGESRFSGNTAGGKSNAVYVAGLNNIILDQYYDEFDGNTIFEGIVIPANAPDGQLTLESVNRGRIVFDDGIDGENYNIDVFGDGTGYVKFNNAVENVNRFAMNGGAVVHLGLNGRIYAQDFVSGSSSVYARTGAQKPLLTVDVMVDRENNTVHSGAIHVNGDVAGETNVLVNALNPDVLDNKKDAVVPFLFAPNDNEETSAVFNVSRVIGSPYMWHAGKNVAGTPESGNVWYLSLTDTLNPEFGKTDPEVAPEVTAYISLPSAGLEQVRGLRDTLEQKTAFCKEGACARDAKADRQLWVDSGYLSSTVDKPAEFDADIWGVTAGGDLQYDANNRLGVFAAYRQGDYDVSGKGSKYRSTVGSELDIDSWLGGLYYRFEQNDWYAFATVYGGLQKADLKTDDGIVNTDSDGTLWSIGAEGGRKYGLSEALTLEPSFGVFYTQSEFDDIRDSAGKTASFDSLKQLEIETAVKLEYRLCQNDLTSVVYIKPGLIQTITDGDEVLISGLGKTEAYHDQLLGRIELGARFGVTESLSGYGWANYTFGSSYGAAAVGIGLNYAF
ncbi:MAG: autotransporter domain-containing protein [Alphaproteobacteria bacterium]